MPITKEEQERIGKKRGYKKEDWEYIGMGNHMGNISLWDSYTPERKEKDKLRNKQNKKVGIHPHALQNIKQATEQYKMTHAEEIKAKAKIYREKNKEEIAKKKKAYKLKKKAEVAEYNKKYYKETKAEKPVEEKKVEKVVEKVVEKKVEKKVEGSVKVKCECGTIVRKDGLTAHKKTKKHATLMSELNA